MQNRPTLRLELFPLVIVRKINFYLLHAVDLMWSLLVRAAEDVADTASDSLSASTKVHPLAGNGEQNYLCSHCDQ